MSNKKVLSELENSIFPTLESNGFSAHRGRSFWKTTELGIFHFCSDPVTKGFADIEEIPSFSFVMELGIYYFCIERTRKLQTKNFLPPIEDCHLRTVLMKELIQPEYPRKDIWYVKADCSNLKIIGEAAKRSLLNTGLPWVSEFSVLTNAFDAIYFKSESDRVKGWGVAGSPAYYKYLGNIALELGRKEIAYDAFRQVIEGPFRPFAYDVQEQFETLKAEFEK